jgi:hypothetical protein
MARRFSEVSTSWPRPPAPIIEAMITMLSDSMITWLTPTIRVGRAAGIITFHRSWRREQPAMWPNSTISVATSRSASMVQRTIGGMA